MKGVNRHLIPAYLFFPLSLFLPELSLHPFHAEAPCSWAHPLGTDGLGRDGLLRLVHASGRTFGFASGVSLLTLCVGLLLALGEERLRGARSALRAVPALLILLGIAAWMDGLGWFGLGVTLALLLANHVEEPLRTRLDSVRQSPAWWMARIQGATRVHKIRTWAPWALGEALGLMPTVWITVVWDEAALRLLGLGPPPTQDSLGLVLGEELPRLATDPTPLGWAALAMVTLLAASYGWEES